MAYREVSRVEIAEVVRRWQSGMSQRQIATGTGLSRATVRRYIDAAVEVSLARDGPAPSEEQLTRLAGLSLACPRRVETPTDDLLAGRGCRVLVHVVEAVHRAAGLAEAESRDGPDGRERTRRGGGDGLRPSGSDGGPGDGSPPHLLYSANAGLGI